MSEETQKRQIAVKVRIKDLINGKYIKEDGWNPNYILLDNKKIARVNIIGIVVSIDIDSKKGLTIDDGAKISIRSFEENTQMSKLEIGDVVMTIGRPREYNEEKYILPEIIKKIDKAWINVRKKEFEKTDEIINKEKTPIENKDEKIEQTPAKAIEKKIEEKITKTNKTPSEKIFNLIKEMDNGDGADTEDVITKANLDNSEKIIKSLLEEGEIFEVRPGKLKVLE